MSYLSMTRMRTEILSASISVFSKNEKHPAGSRHEGVYFYGIWKGLNLGE